jgi:hypothetical protein
MSEAAHAEVKQVVLSAEAIEFVNTRILPLVRSTQIKKNYNRARVGGVSQSTVFGYGNRRKGYGYFNQNAEYPQIYAAILEFGFRWVPRNIPWTSITLNSSSYQTRPHKDIYNIGESFTFSFGDFSGGELVIAGEEYQTEYAPVIFNAKENEHFNKQIEGDRNSLIYYVRALKDSTQEDIERIHYSLWNPYVVAIPSYNRSREIVAKTLATLKNGLVNPNSIYIFVADEEEKAVYQNAIPTELYREIVVGEKGIVNIRNFISSYFRENQYIVSIDDDISAVKELREGKLETIANLHKFFIDAYLVLLEQKLYLWGVYPVAFSLQMSHSISTSFKFLIGLLHGYINRKSADLILSTEIESKEDYERSILFHIKDGGVVRFNNITYKTKFYQPGGLGTKEDRREKNRIAAEHLLEKYPLYSRSAYFHEKKETYEVKLFQL